MASLRISQLTAVVQPSSTDVLPIVNEGDTKKITIEDVSKYSSIYTHASFLPLSGGTITGNLETIGTLKVGSIFNSLDGVSFVVENDGTLEKRSINRAATDTINTFVSANQNLIVNRAIKGANSNGANNSIIFDDGTNVGIGTDFPNKKLTISGDISATGTAFTFYGSSITDSVSSIVVGGAPISPASFWKTRTINQVLDSILFPDLFPTYIIPSISIVGNHSGTKEVGETIQQNLTITGVENDAGIFTFLSIQRNGSNINTINNPSGTLTTPVPSQFGFESPNNPNNSYSLSHTDNFSIPAPAGSNTSSTTTWRANSNYNAGLRKLDNKGVLDSRSFAIRSVNNPQDASSGYTSGNITVTGIYPYFWGISNTSPTPASIASAINSGIGANLVLADATNTVTINNFNANNQFIWVAIHQNYPQKTKWYNTDFNQGNIGGSGDFILAPTTASITSQYNYWTTNFRLYISAYLSTTSGSYQFRNS